MRLLLAAFLFVTNSVAFCAGACASTPAQAVRSFEDGATGNAGTGYRVVAVRTDALLGVRWADVKRCDHPEWPGVTVGTNATAATPLGQRIAPRAVVIVRAGETVKVWRHEDRVRLEMAAVSDEGGEVGDRIRLHVATANGEPVRYCYGLVRGPADVEMER